MENRKADSELTKANYMEYLTAMWELAVAGEKQGIVFFIALYCFLAMSISLIGQWRMRQWPSTTGKLLKAGTRTFGAYDTSPSETQYMIDVLYEYEVRGKKHRGKRVSPWIFITNHNASAILNHQFKSIDRRGDQVRIFFNPNNPKKSTLLRPGWFGICVSVAIWIGPLIGYWASYH